jgi:tRNA pseudouridine55 synthase
VIFLEGVLNIFKPAGMTSHDVVSFLRREFKIKKIGHAGTLDPQAAGVLPLCVGKATRLVEFLIEQDKEYLCELTFGITTETQDAWGKIVKTGACDQLALEKIKSKIPQFLGQIKQKIPAYSAVKVDGLPFYKRTRLGIETKPRFRQVHVYKIDIIKYAPPRLTFMINCSKGTYVRTICHDLGEALGVGGHMSFLLRTKVGNFTLAESITLEETVTLKEKALLPLEVCVEGMSQIVLSEKELKKIKQGQMLFLSKPVPLLKNIAVFNDQGKLEAIAAIFIKNNNIILKPKKVLKRE